MLKSGKIFEYGSIIHVNKDNTLKDLEATIGSIMSQSTPSRKIVAISWERSFSISTKWINEISSQVKKLGGLDFAFIDIKDDDIMNFKDATIAKFKTFIDKQIPVMLETAKGKKKSFLRLSHFLVIQAGDLLVDSETIAEEMDRSYSKNRSLITTFNLMSENKKKIKDENNSPLFINSAGFKFHISIGSTKCIYEQYADIEKARNDVITDKFTENEAKDINSTVFSKNSKTIIRSNIDG